MSYMKDFDVTVPCGQERPRKGRLARKPIRNVLLQHDSRPPTYARENGNFITCRVLLDQTYNKLEILGLQSRITSDTPGSV